MNAFSNDPTRGGKELAWHNVVTRYQNPDLVRSIGQLCSSVIPYLLLWTLMVLSLRFSYWLTLVLAIPAGGFMIRIFIIFHDCGHGSFFKSNKANTIVGTITGFLTFTPFAQWTRAHAIHHATAADLDRRGTGDVKVLTVKEYLDLPLRKRMVYRAMRNPLIMLGLGPSLVFLVGNRFASPGVGQRERESVILTNLVLAVAVIVLSLTIGFKALVLVQMPIVIVGTTVGVWLFYVQHQFEGVYWARHKEWDFRSAALKGSSYYKLPRVLQWFTGNIGFHHIHHLGPRIPNYNLQRCYQENPMFRQGRPMTILMSLKSLKYRLWDEEHNQLVGFGYLKQLRMGEGLVDDCV
jgi:omega-6 fatty acid desaturase (delta-12 desaturase)